MPVEGATRFLSLDPALSCGWAILQVKDGALLSVDVGVIDVRSIEDDMTGPTGVGKSFAVHSCARANGFGVTELSGSERRDASTLKEFMGQMAGATLRNRILLLDNADCMEE